jgi:hypothetical protein
VSASSGGTRNGIPDLLLRPHEALGHRRLGGEEGGGLGRGQPAEQTKGQRDLGLDGECRVAAGEDQGQTLVGYRAHCFLLCVLQGERGQALELGPLRGQRPLAAHPVDGPVPGRRDDPGTWVRRDAVAGPALGGDRERLLDGVLGEVEVAERADQDRDRAPELLPECDRDRVYGCLVGTGINGRTSTAPCFAAGQRAAISSASSSVSASIR